MDSKEDRLIAKCIFEGKTRMETAKILCCSKSALAYKICKLFERYKVKNKHEFMIKVFGEVLFKNKKIINEQAQIIDKLKNQT
ncbi:hypothetical protein IJ670_03495 [bacterium]|nr:hypothetical protein [bacterium]